MSWQWWLITICCVVLIIVMLLKFFKGVYESENNHPNDEPHRKNEI